MGNGAWGRWYRDSSFLIDNMKPKKTIKTPYLIDCVWVKDK